MKAKIKRIFPGFAKDLEYIKIEKIKNGTAKKMISDQRITLAMTRSKFYPLLLKDLVVSNLKEDKRGSILTDMFILIAVVVVALVLFVGWSYAHNVLTSDLLAAGAKNAGSSVNITAATQKTFSPINSAMPILQFLVLGMFVAMIIAIFISNFLIKTHPVFFIIYLLISIVVIIFSVVISNAYESASKGNALTATFQNWIGMNYIMLHLPLIMTVVAFIGGILLYINITRESNTGGVY